MTEPTILCPNCHTEIKLTESLAAPLIESTRKQYEQRIAQKEAEVGKREATVREQQAALVKAQETIDEQIATKLKAERAGIVAEEAKKARLAVSTDLDQKAREVADLQEVLKQKDVKLTEAQKAQAELIRKQRELDDAKREMELTIEKRVQESLGVTRDQARKEAEESLKLKVAEKEQTIASMQKQIEELKRRAEQGSQQLQGEVQELELEAILREKFPRDTIESVPKGEHGGDVLHRVFGPAGQSCGTILWESKRTKNWSDGWLAKLREDMRAARAEVAIVASHVLPKDTDTFSLIDGVWVTSFKCAIPVAVALRHTLIEIAATRTAGEGQQTKMEMVYQYLTGPRFRHRVQAIVEKFTDMHDDLDKERKTMTRLWAKREEQIRGVIESTAGMYGDLQGIAGKTLQEIEGLTLMALPVSEQTDAGDARLAMLFRGPMHDHYDDRVQVQVMAGDRETAERLLAEIRREMFRRNVYRGKIMSIADNQYGRGFFLKFHHLPQIQRDQIILPQGVLERIERLTIDFGRHSKRLRAANLHLKRGILLHGPPGTGKTLTAMHLAGRMPDRTTFLLTGCEYGVLQQACAMARALQPAMIILEDVDLIAEDREDSGRCSQPLLFELLNQMEGLAEDMDIIFLLTSNRPERLERALASRPGRVDQAIEVPSPDADCRLRLFNLYGQGLSFAPDVNLPDLVKRTKGVSAAFIRELLRKAALFAADDHAVDRNSDVPLVIEHRHFDAAMYELMVAGGSLTQRLLGVGVVDDEAE